MKKQSGQIIFSPSDLIRYVKSPFASWLDRYLLENPGAIEPAEETEDEKLIAQTGNRHEQSVLEQFRSTFRDIAEISRDGPYAVEHTLAALNSKAPIIYQAALADGKFSGFADFLILDASLHYEIWDTKLARSPKPYYAIQLCCYSELLAATTGKSVPEKFGIILGNNEKVEFRTEDFIHYYRRVKASFLALQNSYTGNLNDCPEPLAGADHGRWSSRAQNYFDETDHLVNVAGITVGQIKKLKATGIATMAALGTAAGKVIPKLSPDTLDKLVAQARLQNQTQADRATDSAAFARFEVLAHMSPNGQPVGLATLPPAHPADVFFDMEGFPLAAGGLEYLFGACSMNRGTGGLEFRDWWAHDRNEEKLVLERFVDWVYNLWRENPGMHIYHYAGYEVSAVRRLSTRHDTRQSQVDDLLRNHVFVDLYRSIRQGLRIGERGYSIKDIEHLYRPRRTTEVATAMDSVVHYARWLESDEPPDWNGSPILRSIREYNEDDCVSAAQLAAWLRKVAAENKIEFKPAKPEAVAAPLEKDIPPEVLRRLETIGKLRKQGDEFSATLADLLDFHRREEKPMWWRMFDREVADADELRDDSGCIQGICATGSPHTEKLSLIQVYTFDPSQECKLGVDDTVMFTHNIDAKLTLIAIDIQQGTLALKISAKSLREKLGGSFPKQGSLIPYEYVAATAIQAALTDIGASHVSGKLRSPIIALLGRTIPGKPMQSDGETTIAAGVRISKSMNGGCLVVQGPPGTGKTYTAAHIIKALLAAGMRVGVASNSHKAIVNLLIECGKVTRADGGSLRGIKVGGEGTGPLFTDNPQFGHVKEGKEALAAYGGGVIGGTAWLFSRPEWEGALDFLFIDEAGQVSLANALAMARSAGNIVLLGDQMQLEQPIQGTHPGDAGLSSLQYALKDLGSSRIDSPVFHAVVPAEFGLFLGESRRMHPDVCSFVSESIYEGRLKSHADCARQTIEFPGGERHFALKRSGVVFSGVEHDGNIQQSEEEVERVKSIYDELQGCAYTDSEGKKRPLALEDFLFIAPYNAQVRALQAALPAGARVGSVDKFQGQEAPVCILSLCSSYGEYGSRGLGFILDRNRINVAISRAKCLSIVVADPRIASAAAGSIAEMKLLNVFCKLVNL